MLAKYDSSGAELWRKELSFRIDEHRYRVDVDGEGNVYIATDVGSPSRTWLSVKFDPVGNEIWSREFTSP